MKKYQRLAAVLLTVALLTGNAVTVRAAEAEELTPEEQTAKIQEELYKLPVQTNEIEGWPQAPGTCGEAAIVMEAGTGAILYARNIDTQLYPASITKVLTALVAVENAQMADPVTFSYDSIAHLEAGYAKIGMKEGNVISVEQALHAVLLASANEVSYALGESIGKNLGYDYAWFLEQMNNRCKELGGMSSSFVNTSGVHDDNHYTCARDMALISSEVFKYPQIFSIMQTQEYKIPASSTTEEHVFQQKHKMLLADKEVYYEYAVGGKTGYTDAAMTTLITMADNGEMQLVCVLLKNHGAKYVYSDTQALLEYGFANFQKVDISQQEMPEEVMTVLAEEGQGYVMLPAGASFSDLEMEIVMDEENVAEDGEKEYPTAQATLSYTYEGQYVGEVRAIVQTEEIEEELVQEEEQPEEDAEKETPGRSQTENIILIGAGVVLAVLTGLAIWQGYRLWAVRNRRKKKE